MITSRSQAELPAIVGGGIVADDMGLGKTIQVLSVVLSNAPGSMSGGGHTHCNTTCNSRYGEEGCSRCGGIKEEACAGEVCVEEATLIVCPMSVITSWESQTKQHTGAGRLGVTVR